MSKPKTIARKEKSKKNTAPKNTAAERKTCSAPAACCEQIRETAYYKWEAAGCPCGEGVEFWLEAEAELTGDAQHSELK